MNDLELTICAFQSFVRVAPRQAKAWMGAVQELGAASALDQKTAALGYVAVLAALRLLSGIPFHVTHAKSLGAAREEVASAVLPRLPAAGNGATQALPTVLAAWDGTGSQRVEGR
jgi:alkylhydroperoxidase/carboxymuconolactone decarboxylase family protein YurZ